MPLASVRNQLHPCRGASLFAVRRVPGPIDRLGLGRLLGSVGLSAARRRATSGLCGQHPGQSSASLRRRRSAGRHPRAARRHGRGLGERALGRAHDRVVQVSDRRRVDPQRGASSPRDSCLLPASACGACLDGFNFADCSCDEGATEGLHVWRPASCCRSRPSRTSSWAQPRAAALLPVCELRAWRLLRLHPRRGRRLRRVHLAGRRVAGRERLHRRGRHPGSTTRSTPSSSPAGRPSPPAPTAARPRAPRTLTRAARARWGCYPPRSPTTRPSSTATSTTAATSLPSRSARLRAVPPAPHRAPRTSACRPRRPPPSQARDSSTVSSTAAGCW